MDKKISFTRRHFCKFLGLAGVGALELSLFRPELAQAAKYHKTTKTLPLMNTFVNITIYDKSKDKAISASEQAFEKIKNLIPTFNRYDPNGELGFLNKSGYLNQVPPKLYEILSYSKQISLQTKNSFDVTVLPLLELYKQSFAQNNQPPSKKDLNSRLPLTGYQNLHLGRKSIRLSTQGAGLTLDGIAKGYLVDQAADQLRKLGINYALINAGGDLRAIGDKAGSPWRIGLEDPENKYTYAQNISIKDLAVATSGSYENFFDPLGKHHHLIKGKPSTANRTISSTVVASSAMQADALSTAFFIPAPETGLRLAESIPEIEACLIARGKRMFRTKGWKKIIA